MLVNQQIDLDNYSRLIFNNFLGERQKYIYRQYIANQSEREKYIFLAIFKY